MTLQKHGDLPRVFHSTPISFISTDIRLDYFLSDRKRELEKEQEDVKNDEVEKHMGYNLNFDNPETLSRLSV